MASYKLWETTCRLGYILLLEWRSAGEWHLKKEFASRRWKRKRRPRGSVQSSTFEVQDRGQRTRQMFIVPDGVQCIDCFSPITEDVFTTGWKVKPPAGFHGLNDKTDVIVSVLSKNAKTNDALVLVFHTLYGLFLPRKLVSGSVHHRSGVF